MMKSLFFGSLLLLLFPMTVFSAESDDFYARNQPLKDSADIINGTANRYLEDAISAYNKKNLKTCNSTQLMELLRLKLNTNYSQILTDLEEDKNLPKFESKYTYRGSILDRTPNPNPNSVYQSIWASTCCSSMINVNNHRIGIDKIDHIFSHGLPYYQIVKATGKLDTALDLGIKQEEGCWGLACNGVKSYADLAANYQGYLLWSNMIDGPNPYIKCVSNKFEIARKIDVRTYIDDSLDEAINCSSYDTPERAAGVLRNIKALGFERCPVKPSACDNLIKKYPPAIAKKIIHNACLEQNKKDVSFVEKEGSEEGLDWIDTIKMGTKDVKVKNLLKGVGIR